MTDPSFPLGASYYPPHHDPQDWPRDLAAMAQAGMTCIRSAELLASWDYIEKVRGQPDWAWLDALFDTAQQHGLRLLLGTGSPSPPIWLLDRYPDVQIIDREGQPFPTGTVWGWACRNHPGYRAEVERYLQLLLTRYAGHPALWAWQIDNEPGYPFVTRRGETTPRIYDYNPHTASAFRDWLQQKYASIAALNIAWRWDCTHHQYTDWAQVQPPRSMPQEWGIVTAWLDWRTFLYENMAAFVRWQHDMIKKVDQQHPTMTNIFAFSGREVEMGLDPWLMARQVDAIGYDLYPGIGRRLHRDPEYISLFLDLGRSTALHAGGAFWLPELESGPINGWALGPDYTTTPQDITRYNLEALGHGAKAILYQGYREWPCIPIHWGALADLAGRPTARYTAAQRINRMVRAHEHVFQVAQPPRAQVAIWYDTRTLTLLHGMDALDLAQRCVRGAYTALWRAGYAIEFIDRHALIASDTLPYQVLLLPAALLIDTATSAALTRFVMRGGTLIGFAKCAWVDQNGWSWAEQPGAGLAALFGIDADEIARDDHPQVRIDEKDGASQLVAGYWHRQPLIPHANAETLGYFDDGTPALVQHQIGQGQTFYFGTHVDAAATDAPATAQLLCSLVARAGIHPLVQCEGGSAAIDTHLLIAGTRRLIILTNNSAQSTDITLRIPAYTPTAAIDILAGGGDMLQTDGSIRVHIPAWEGAVVLTEAAE